MKAVTMIGALIPLTLVCGCIQSHRAAVVYPEPAVVYTPQPVLPPTSSRPDTRVYSEPSAPPAPPSVAPGDVAVATGVSQLLKGDTHLASLSSNVEASVENGVVTLRGTVPSEHARDEIVQRVSLLPGVRSVNDQLGIELR